jgi:hypothetical protein
MHNHSDLRRFFGTQPFVKCKTFRASVPQNDMTSAPPFICHSEERSDEESPHPNAQTPTYHPSPQPVILNPKTLWQCYNSQIAPYLLFVVIRGEESPHPNAQSLRPSQILRDSTIFSQSFTIQAFVPQNDMTSAPPFICHSEERSDEESAITNAFPSTCHSEPQDSMTVL